MSTTCILFCPDLDARFLYPAGKSSLLRFVSLLSPISRRAKADTLAVISGTRQQCNLQVHKAAGAAIVGKQPLIVGPADERTKIGRQRRSPEKNGGERSTNVRPDALRYLSKNGSLTFQRRVFVRCETFDMTLRIFSENYQSRIATKNATFSNEG